MPQQTLFALTAGLLPVLLTWLLTSLEQRGQEARRDKAIAVAQRQIQFLQTYLTAHTMATPPDQLEPMRQLVAKETERIFAELTEELNEIDGSLSRMRGKNAMQKVLLLYKMRSLGARILRLVYLLSLPVAILMTIVVIDVATQKADGEILVTVLTILLASLPFTLPTVALRWLAVALEQRAAPHPAPVPPAPVVAEALAQVAGRLA